MLLSASLLILYLLGGIGTLRLLFVLKEPIYKYIKLDINKINADILGLSFLMWPILLLSLFIGILGIYSLRLADYLGKIIKNHIVK